MNLKNASIGMLVLFGLLLMFQNCSPIRVTDLSEKNPVESLNSYNNGGAYEGKPESFYRFNTEFKCQDQLAPIGILNIGKNISNLILNSANTCGNQNLVINNSQIDVSTLQKSIVGYGEGIYEYFPQVPARTPDRIVEFWCKNGFKQNVPEVISRFNSVDQKTYIQIYYASPSGAGGASTLPEFTVTQSQYPGGKEALINDTVGFRMFVNYDFAVRTVSGQIDSNIEVFLEGRYIQEVLYCRSGGRFDVLR